MKRFFNFVFLLCIIPLWSIAIGAEMYLKLILDIETNFNERLTEFVNETLI